MADELEVLRGKTAELSEQLDKATKDMKYAAQMGLELLEQKNELERRLAEMQADLDATRAEVDKANQVRRVDWLF